MISAFGANALSGAGTLLNLKFNVVGAGGAATALAWQAFVLNEGEPSSTTANGGFAVNNLPPHADELESDFGHGGQCRVQPHRQWLKLRSRFKRALERSGSPPRLSSTVGN